ncbi:hypothetical protein JHK82_042251 [Glycine max]|nr:hypothetical protein JHK82_042251 [Glycine max]
MEAKSLLQGSSLKPSYPLPKLSKTTMMTANCVRFSFNYNNPCLLFANGYPSSSSLPLSLQNKPRKSASVIVSARKKDKKEDTHSSVPKPDEVTGFFPEAVLLKKRTVEEEGKLLPEFEDAEERQLFEALMLELDSDMDVEILRHYEVMYLIHEKHEEEVAAVNEKIQDFLREKKGQVWRLNDWGMRRLAYKIKKANNAHYMLINFELDAKYINDFKTLLDQDERVIRHLVIKRDEAITEDCPPPPEFHTLRANADDNDDEEFDENYDDDWDGEDEEDGNDGDDGENGIIFVDDDDDDIDSRNETPANVRQPDIRKLRAENVGMQSSSKLYYGSKYRKIQFGNGHSPKFEAGVSAATAIRTCISYFLPTSRRIVQFSNGRVCSSSKVDGALGNEVAPRRPTDNSNDGLSTQGYTPLTIDPNDIEKPLGIDCKQWAHCHTHKTCRSEHMHGNEVEPATRSTVVPENNSRDDRPCRAQNKLGDRLEDSTTTTQSFHQKGNDADERCHDMAESNMVKDNQARDPAVDEGGSQIWWALLIVPVLKPKNRFGPTD